jgi:transposase InsO family protein
MGLSPRRHAAMLPAGKPVQNAFIESFNGRFLEEYFDQSVSHNFQDARPKIDAWWQDYNHASPLTALNCLILLELREKHSLQPHRITIKSEGYQLRKFTMSMICKLNS